MQMGIEDIVGSRRVADIASFRQREADRAARYAQDMANIELAARQAKKRRAEEDEAVERAQAERVAQTELLSALSTLSEEQAQTLAALSKASQAQVQTLAAMRQLSEDLAGERRRSAAREDRQQAFNKGMTILASVLAGAAVVVPFCIFWMEQALKK